jgi:hypothetical protein
LDELKLPTAISTHAPDDGRKHRPKHVELTWNNKLNYIVHLVGYFYSCIMMHRFPNVKFINTVVSIYTTHSNKQCRFVYLRQFQLIQDTSRQQLG